MDLLTWTMLHRRMLIPERPFDLAGHPFLREVYESRARVLVVRKASQVGASEYLITYGLHGADQRGATVLYLFPTDTHVSDFSAARLGPALEASPYLAQVVEEGGPPAVKGTGGRRRGADRVTLKRVRDRFVYFRGAQVGKDGSAPQLKSIDADVLILDEVDEMDSRAPEIALKRLGHSRIAEERWVSTPSYPGMGIEGAWERSDQREWHVRCGHCGHWQALTIDHVVTEWDSLQRPTRWNGQRPDRSKPDLSGRDRAANVPYEDRAWAACERCGGKVDRLGRGEWVATWPGRDVVGFHPTKLHSPRVELIDIVRALQTTDETRRKECYNQDLGLPYVPRGGQLTGAILDKCRREYGHGVLPAKQGTVMGVDVGKVLHGVIRARTEDGSMQVWAGEVDSFEELGRMCRRYNVQRLVIDALPETRKARELQQVLGEGVVWLAYYVSQRIGTKRAEPIQWDNDNGVVNLDRTRSLDRMLSRFYEGVATLPGDAREIPGYYEHMTGPVRVIEDGPGGERVARYVCQGADHLFHAENYAMVAGEAPEAGRGFVFAY